MMLVYVCVPIEMLIYVCVPIELYNDVDLCMCPHRAVYDLCMLCHHRAVPIGL